MVAWKEPRAGYQASDVSDFRKDRNVSCGGVWSPDAAVLL